MLFIYFWGLPPAHILYIWTLEVVEHLTVGAIFPIDVFAFLGGRLGRCSLIVALFVSLVEAVTMPVRYRYFRPGQT